MGAQIAQAITNRRPPVIWLSAQGMHRMHRIPAQVATSQPGNPYSGFDLLDYHEALSVPAGHLAEQAKHHSMEANKGKYLLVDGSIPTKDGGIYCKIANKTTLEHLEESAAGAAAIVAIGSCAAWGGIPASDLIRPRPNRFRHHSRQTDCEYPGLPAQPL
ncbi:MAG: hypothetical protein R3F37_04610 [Candidatus Competibacteraceae bacterium]